MIRFASSGGWCHETNRDAAATEGGESGDENAGDARGTNASEERVAFGAKSSARSPDVFAFDPADTPNGPSETTDAQNNARKRAKSTTTVPATTTSEKWPHGLPPFSDSFRVACTSYTCAHPRERSYRTRAVA